jgi:miniconductance mechanosensitive channel
MGYNFVPLSLIQYSGAVLVGLLFMLYSVSFGNGYGLIAKNQNQFDDLLVTNKTAKHIAHHLLLFIYKAVPVILNKYEYWEGVSGNRWHLYRVFAFYGLWTIFNALKDYLKLKLRYSTSPSTASYRLS